MSEFDYTKIERPVEPAFENEDPEQWCQVLAWEEARGDALTERVKELEEAFAKLKVMAMQEREWRIEDSELGNCEAKESLESFEYKIDKLLDKE